MTEFEMPKFDFSGEVVDDFVDAGTRKKFNPGKYDLKILTAYYSGALIDPTWGKIKVVLGSGEEGDERTITSTICIPLTASFKYVKPGAKPNNSDRMAYLSAFPFFGALGEIRFTGTNGSRQDLISAVQKALSSCKKGEAEVFDAELGQKVPKTVPLIKSLIGKTVSVQLGFEGKYYHRDEDTGLWGMYEKGTILPNPLNGQPATGETFDDVKLIAIENEWKETYISVLKYFTKPKAVTTVEVNDDFNDIAF